MIDVLYPIEKQIRLELDNDFSWYRLNQMGFTDEKIHALLDERIEEIMEYTGESPQVVCDKISHSNGEAVKEWQSLEPYTREDIAHFHTQTRRKIYSLTGTCDYLAVIREKTLRTMVVGETLLDFGGSHGHFSLAAAQKGLNVTYADIGLEVRDFVKWRANKRGIKINFAPIEDNKCVFTDHKYDYIVCLDVVSHLPNLSQYMSDFHSCLNDDGKLILGDDLCDFIVPWHLQENTVYRDPARKAELFKDFIPIERVWANCTIYGKKGI